MSSITLKIIAVLLLTLSILACNDSKSTVAPKGIDEISFRLDREPLSLSPILSNSSRDRYVHEYLFISLGDYDPVSLELVPVMIEELPSVTEITEGPFKGGEAYNMRILDEASWQNGSPITGKDVLFTMKMVAHPEVSTTWKPLLDDVYDIKIDPDDPKTISILTSGDYYLNLETILSAEIYPSYVYDPNDLMSKISLPELKEVEANQLELEYPAISELAQTFSSVENQKEIVEGAGPYKLHSWETGQYIILDKKENYWGEAFPDNILLKAIPNRMIFQIVPDENVALTLLKNDEVDVVNLYRSPYVVFDDLKADKSLEGELDFYVAEVPTSYVIMLNNADPRLAELEVRKAITLLTNTERMLNQIEGGYGERINSIVHPVKDAHNNGLEFFKYSPVIATEILQKAGWVDSDGNGIRDKSINGKKEELSFDFLITSSSASTNISSILKHDLSKAGISLNPIVKSFRDIQPELNSGKYEFSVLAISSSTALFADHYNRWHSSSIDVDGGNYARYNNPEADTQIEIIRNNNVSNANRKEAFYKLQEIMLYDYTALFLYTPQNRIAVDEDFEPVLSSKRPGYVANAFSRR